MIVGLLALLLVGGTPPPDTVININTASIETLKMLPGIGSKKAEAIVQFRAKKPFRRTQELMRIRGIGPKLYERLKPFVSVETAAPPLSGETRDDKRGLEPPPVIEPVH